MIERPFAIARTMAGIMPAALAAMCFAAGCADKSGPLSDPQKQQLVGLVMPEHIKIVPAFTTFKSFDEDNTPDGIGLTVQPVDFYGDPVKIAGTVRAELYTYVPASGLNEGARVCDPWEIALTSEHEERMYWNVVTSMYEFPLELPAGLAAAGNKYVLNVIYNSPLDTHLSDSMVIELPGVPPLHAKRPSGVVHPGVRSAKP